jgi:hypothetical protein
MLENNKHDIEVRNLDYVDKDYLGIVEDPNDPRKEGRCRIRVFGIHDDLETEDLPWAYPKQKGAYFGQDGKGGSISIPKKNAVVAVRFNNGNIYSPEFYSIHELAEDAKEQLQKEGEYLGTHIMLFDGDEELKIWFTIGQGLTIQLKQSRIKIEQDSSIHIEHHDRTIGEGSAITSSIELRGGEINITSNSTINLTSGSEIEATSNDIFLNGNTVKVGHNPIQGSAVLGDQLFLLLERLADIIDAKAPTSLGAAKSAVKLSKGFSLSETVKVAK